MTNDNLAILVPYNKAEAITVREAALIAGRCEKTIQNWCNDHNIGRMVVGRYAVSIVALSMKLDGDIEALHMYLSGDRESERVRLYFNRHKIALPL